MCSICVFGPIDGAGVSLAGGISFLVVDDDLPFPLPFPLERAVGAPALAEMGCRLTGGRLVARLPAGAAFFAGAFFAGAFFAVDFAGALFAAVPRLAGFFAAGFLVGVRLAGAFFAAGLFAAVRFAGLFFALDFAGVFLAAGFFAAGFLAGALFAAGFLAGALFAAGFLAGVLFAAGFFVVLDLRAAGFEEDDPVLPVDLRDEVERLVRLRSSAITVARQRSTGVGRGEPVSA
jgi:hypothetical protein